MKTFHIILAILFLFFIDLSCTNEDQVLLDEIERVLPGDWHVDSYKMPAYGMGIRYQGDTIFTDTILYDFADVYIPPFSTDTLNYISSRFGIHECSFYMDNQSLPFVIESISADYGTDDYFVYFRDYNYGWANTGTDAEKFFADSRIFFDNLIVVVHDDNSISIHEPFSGEHDGKIITLSRK